MTTWNKDKKKRQQQRGRIKQEKKKAFELDETLYVEFKANTFIIIEWISFVDNPKSVSISMLWSDEKENLITQW